MVKRYILFVYDNYEPYGGPGDIVAHADSVEEGEALANQHLQAKKGKWSEYSADIYDCEGQDVVQTRGGHYGSGFWTVLKDWKRRP